MRRKRLVSLVLGILISLLWVSCNEPLIELKKVDCYFQYEYLNHAWGYSHGGFTITPTGEVYVFDKTTPWVFAKDNILSSASMMANLQSSVKRDTLIHESDLEYFQQLAYIAKSGVTSPPVLRGADMGAILCKIIIPDPADPTNYREIILRQTGDTEYHNLTHEAGVISDWLVKIHLP